MMTASSHCLLSEGAHGGRTGCAQLQFPSVSHPGFERYVIRKRRGRRFCSPWFHSVDIGRFLVSIKMFRSAFCECHFTMRMPVHLWNASMV